MTLSDDRSEIPPNPPRWQPNLDPASIEVPGLDTNASVHDQIEQIEQLITIKLQNIDENFSKIHNVLSSKILPAVKRYAVGTEPVREAAKFWTSFYEQAAQIHIPTYDDYSTVNEQPSEHAETDTETSTHSGANESEVTHQQSQDYEPSMASTENSFMPGQAPFSSTPARDRVGQTHDSFDSQSSEGGTWTTSLESPLVRLDREIQNFTKEDESLLAPSSSLAAPSMYTDPNPSPSPLDRTLRSEKGKGKEASQPLLRNLLRQNLYTSDVSSTTPSYHTSPLRPKVKPKTPVPIKNPFLPPNADASSWNGVVDLRDRSITTPQRNRKYGHGPSSSRRNPVTPAHESDDDDDDSWEGGLPPGMSPPVLMSPARPPRSSAELGLLKLGQTPTKEAAARITRDLVSDFQRKGEGPSHHPFGNVGSIVESSMSTVPSPPSLSRYRRTQDSIDPSLDSAMGRMQLNVQPATPPTTSPEYSRYSPTYTSYPEASPEQRRDEGHYQYMTPLQNNNNLNLDDDSFSDSMDEINNTAHPSAAFLMASARRSADDSFGSSNESIDSLDAEDADLDLAPVHPFAREVSNESYDDSFDDYPGDVVPEETLFGVPPQQRAQGQGRMGDEFTDDGNLRLHAQDLFPDTGGLTAQLNKIEHSPTPASWGRN